MRNRWVVGMCATWLGVACANGTPSVGAAPAHQRDSVFIAVENQNFYDAHVYAEFEGHLLRHLGMVSGFARDTFAVEWRNTILKMQTRFVGAGRTVSNDLTVAPGDLVELVIQPQSHRRDGQ